MCYRIYVFKDLTLKIIYPTHPCSFVCTGPPTEVYIFFLGRGGYEILSISSPATKNPVAAPDKAKEYKEYTV